MMSICCAVQYNEESSRPPHQDNELWHGRPRICRQTIMLLVSVILLFASYVHKTARIADGIMAATSSSPRVPGTAFGGKVGSMRPCSRNNSLTTDKINAFAVQLLLACDLMGMVAVIFRCTFVLVSLLSGAYVCSLGRVQCRKKLGAALRDSLPPSDAAQGHDYTR